MWSNICLKDKKVNTFTYLFTYFLVWRNMFWCGFQINCLLFSPYFFLLFFSSHWDTSPLFLPTHTVRTQTVLRGQQPVSSLKVKHLLFFKHYFMAFLHHWAGSFFKLSARKNKSKYISGEPPQKYLSLHSLKKYSLMSLTLAQYRLFVL